jgi:hypothetical protein
LLCFRSVQIVFMVIYRLGSFVVVFNVVFYRARRFTREGIIILV